MSISYLLLRTRLYAIVLWDMNELDWRTETQTSEVEQTNEEGESETVMITETVLIIELTHHTPEKMRETYHFTDRQNEYLTLLSDEDNATLWGGDCWVVLCREVGMS